MKFYRSTTPWSRLCPFCGDYSLTLDLRRHAFICHAYGAMIPIERMNREN